MAFDLPVRLALAPASEIPNYDAIALSPVAGWLIFGCVLGLVTFFVAHREGWRRLWLTVADPRPVAVFRILFVAMTLFNVNGLIENWTYLFTDEGIFPTDVAQQVRASRQFAGFADGLETGEPAGFYDFAAFLEWLKGPNYSLLLFEGSPTFFYLHIVAFEIAMLMLLVGYQTRWVKWVAWFLFHSIILRNTLYWEGTENVYRSFLFYLCLARCGHAYSVDNWLRCRKLRKRGELSTRDGPGGGAGAAPDAAHPRGLQAIYRLIPRWPVLICMMQTATLYTTAGLSKNGPVWHRGDGFYYALNLDHFYRVPPQWVSSIFGTNFFRLNAHIVHYWQLLFPLMLVGLVLRWHMREKPPLSAREQRIGRLGLGAAVGFFLGLVWYLYPVHYAAPPEGPSLELARSLAVGGGAAGLGAVAWLYGRLRTRPFVVDLRGHPYRLDLDWFCRWFLGRRVWLLLGAIFHVHLIIMVNVGWFNPGLFTTYVLFLSGAELAFLGRSVGKRLARLRVPVSASVARGEPPLPGEDPTLPHHRRDGSRLPLASLLTGLAVAVLGVVRDVQTRPDMWEAIGRTLDRKTRLELGDALSAQVGHVGWGWFWVALAVFLVTLTVRMRRGHAYQPAIGIAVVAAVWAGSLLHERELLAMGWVMPVVFALTLAGTRGRGQPVQDAPVRDSDAGVIRLPWAYGPLGRTLVNGLVVYHLCAIAIWLLPEKWSLSTFRTEARDPIKWWVQTTQTTQSWGMFAPNPPRANMFMRVLVYDDGEVFDTQNDVYACFESGDPEVCDAVYPMPWLTYTRQRKMNRRIAGSEGGNGVWAQKWHARYLCRAWALEHDGEPPDEVEIWKVTYPVPSPEEVATNGPYDPATHYKDTHEDRRLYTVNCAREPYGLLSNEVRRRHGLPAVDESKLKVWHKNRCAKWEKKLRERARERGEDVADDDPRFERCSRVPDAG